MRAVSLQEISGPAGDDAGEYIAQVIERVDTEESAGLEDGQIGGKPFTAVLAGDEEVIFATDGDGTERLFGRIIVEREEPSCSWWLCRKSRS